MPSVCVDANLILRLLMPDETSQRLEVLWSQWHEDSTTIVAPPLLPAEVSSVIRQGVFFHRLSPEEGESAFQTFCDMNITIMAIPHLHILAWDLSKRHNRPRTYDSFYLAVAQAEGCELWTGDRRLVNAVNLPWVRWIGEAS